MQVFTWNESDVQIRSKIIDGTPWLVAKDLCDYLELNDVSKALERLDDDEKLTRKFFVSGQMRSMWLVNESGTYALILRSNKPKAREFRKWITSEVLPTLRKTGRYELNARRRCLPFEKSVEMCRFFSELTKWTTPADEKMVAEMMNVGVKHVHEVVRGRSQSYGVCCLLVEFAKENRVKGVQRQPRAVSRDADMKELMLEFTEFNGAEE